MSTNTPGSPEPVESTRSDATVTSGGKPADQTPLPAQIGHYRILRKVGEGGMGAVYEAEQEKPRRIVALKVIRPGVAGPQALKRFEHETQILGRLLHPGIAQIYEAGTADAGHGPQPFFAMEFVRGQRLTDYADARRLGTRQRLELFTRICDAVQHAHQKGVIHRDLKPGNILVTDDGQPKILDFGVARATDSDLQATTLRTDIGQLIGTVPYMSPEQVTGDPDQLDTRSDIYALGVVLYELLAGRPPYDLHHKLIHEAVRIIREAEPTRLSSVNKTLRGDVETIISKSLEKDKERRYQAASALAADIRHYLNDEPIAARPPSAAYQVRKFAKRNKVLVGGVAATFVALLGGLAASTTLYYRAEAQRQRAVMAEQEQNRARQEADEQRELAEKRAAETDQVAEFQSKMLSEIDAQLMGARLREDVLAEARAAMEHSRRSDEEITARLGQLEALLDGTNFTNAAVRSLDRNVLQRALEAIDKQFADQPLVQARLLETAADTLYSLGLYDAATAPQERALQTRRSLLGDDHPDTLGSINKMGFLLTEQGKLAEAEPYHREALAGNRRLLGDDHPETLTSIANMGGLLQEQGKLGEAEPFYREALEGRRRVLGDDHPSTLDSIGNMDCLLQAQGKLAEAEPFSREALEGRRRVLGDDHPHTLVSINNLGVLLQAQGKFAEAEPLYREALDGSRRVLGDDHPDTLTSIIGMGVLLQAQGKLAEAEPYYREALESGRRVLGDDHPDVLVWMKAVGSLLQWQGKLAEAEPFSREALEGRRRVLGDDHPDTLLSIHDMGSLLRVQGKLAEAEPFCREALESRRRVLGDDHPDTLLSINNMGRLLQAQGKLTEAEPYLREALESGRRVLGDDNRVTLISISILGDVFRGQGKPSEAIALMTPAEPAVRRVFSGGDTFWLGNFLTALGRCRAATAAFDVAETNLTEGYAILSDAESATANEREAVLTGFAELYDAWHAAELDQGHDAKAAQWRTKLAEWQASTQPAPAPTTSATSQP